MFTEDCFVVEKTRRVTVRVSVNDRAPKEEQHTSLPGQKSQDERCFVIAIPGKAPVKVSKAVAQAAAMVEGISSRKTMRVRVKR